MAVSPEVAAEMVQLCRAIPKHPSKMLRRLASKDAELHKTVSKNGHHIAFLKHAVPSQLVREGRDPRECRLHALVKGCGISYTHLQLNGPSLVCAPHRDGKNASELSHILFLADPDYEGGELNLEDGTVLSERNVWHQFDGKRLLHWNNPVTKGTKWSLVAFETNQPLKPAG